MTQREMATERERQIERDQERGRERDFLGDEEKLSPYLFDAFDATDS